jgi:hypothetical protein
MAETVERTDEEKAAAFSAMTGSISVIDNCLDDSNEFCNDMTNAGKKERVRRLRSKRIDGRIVIGSISDIADNSFQSFVVRRHSCPKSDKNIVCTHCQRYF